MKKAHPAVLFTIALALTISFLTTPASSAVPAYTYTKYPIFLVGGVNDFDAEAIGFEYFYGVKQQIQRSAYTGFFLWPTKRQKTEFIMLSSWEGTTTRGMDLAQKIKDRLDQLDDKYFPSPNDRRVNIIAHSHGSTTARVAMHILHEEALADDDPTNDVGIVASLTTIAGPHYGTATADAGTLDFLPNWLRGVVFWVLNRAGDVMAGITALSEWFLDPTSTPSALAYIGHQDAEQVASDFTQEKMEIFNNTYKCAGLWKNGTYGIQNGHRPQYGADATPGDWAGDGLGHKRNTSNPNATLFYSWMGQTDCPITDFDIADVAMVATWAMSQLYHKYCLTDDATDPFFGDWVIYLVSVLLPSEGTYNGWATDAFIPVTSANFGRHIGTYGPWNHLDEQNQSFGCTPGNAPDPIHIFREHANRLQKAGR